MRNFRLNFVFHGFGGALHGRVVSLDKWYPKL